jgi:hypothetical protein
LLFFPKSALSPRNVIKLEDIPTEQELTSLLLSSLKKTRDAILEKVGPDGQAEKKSDKKKKGKPAGSDWKIVEAEFLNLSKSIHEWIRLG